MKFTQAILFAVMAYQANAGFMDTNQNTDINQTEETHTTNDGGPGGSNSGTQGSQSSNGGAQGVSSAGGAGGQSGQAQSGGVSGGPVAITANHNNEAGSAGDVTLQQTSAPCDGSCISYQYGAPSSQGGSVSDSSSEAYNNVGNTQGTTGAAQSGNANGGSGGNSTATSVGGTNQQKQQQMGGSGGGAGVGQTVAPGGQSSSSDPSSSTSFSPTLALPPIPRIKRYTPGAYNERNAEVLI